MKQANTNFNDRKSEEKKKCFINIRFNQNLYLKQYHPSFLKLQ